MSRQSDLINEVKRIFENETSNDSDQGGECGLDEMARKPFNNTLTEKGKEEITKAVKAMIEEEKEGKAKHSDNYVFKTLAKLAKGKVGEPVTTTELQQVAGVKHPQPMNALLSKLVASGYLERATSHVEPEKGEPKPKGRPKGPEKEKVEKPAKFGGLPLAKKVSPSAIDKDNDGKSDDVVTENLDEASIDEAELQELNLASLEKTLVNKYGAKGDKLAEDESIEEAELGGASTNPTEDTRDNQSAIHPINEAFALMQFRAGIITDTQYRKAIGLDKIK